MRAWTGAKAGGFERVLEAVRTAQGRRVSVVPVPGTRAAETTRKGVGVQGETWRTRHLATQVAGVAVQLNRVTAPRGGCCQETSKASREPKRIAGRRRRRDKRVSELLWNLGPLKADG